MAGRAWHEHLSIRGQARLRAPSDLSARASPGASTFPLVLTPQLSSSALTPFLFPSAFSSLLPSQRQMRTVPTCPQPGTIRSVSLGFLVSYFPCSSSFSNDFFFLITTATATQDPNWVCDLHHSSRLRRILNPLSEARDQTCVLRDASWVHYR